MLCVGIGEGLVFKQVGKGLAHYHEHLRPVAVGRFGGVACDIPLDRLLGVALGPVRAVQAEVIQKAVVEAELVEYARHVVNGADGEGCVQLAVAVDGEKAAEEHGDTQHRADDAGQNGALFCAAEPQAEQYHRRRAEDYQGEDAEVHIQPVFARGLQSLAQKCEVARDEGVVAPLDLEEICVAHQAENEVCNAAGDKAV